MLEEWKSIRGYEGEYEISTTGKVRSLPRNYIHGIITIPTLRKPEFSGGYNRITLFKNGKRNRRPIHVLVAETFIPNPYNKPCVNHLNEIKTDNRVGNLAWCTHKENSNYGNCRSKISEKVSKAVHQCDKSGNVLKTWKSMTEASSNLKKVNISEISSCVSGKAKTAGGYVWRLCTE